MVCTLFLLLAAACTNESHESSVVPSIINFQSKIMSPREKRSFHRWLISEMYNQVCLRKPSGEEESSWLNVLSQGASIEGVYHGIVLSATYRSLEVGTAAPAALKFFAEEAVLLRSGKDKLDDSLKPRVDALLKDIASASPFTLKRELGELLLEEIDKRKNSREVLADWYAVLANRWSVLGVDFGMKQRGNPDRDYQKSWALANSIGFIQWECLNRAHRILNQLAGVARGKK